MAGFSFLQRISKGGQTRAWIPAALCARQIEWAAVREFELLQEAGNLSIEDLEVSELRRSMLSQQKMRAGGYRVVVVTLGCYTDVGGRDDLQILDEKLQEEITRMIHFLYLGEESELRTTSTRCALDQGLWSCADALPHVAQTLGAKALFKPAKQTREEAVFFNLLQNLPARHIVHDVAVGLALPDATKEKNWVYIAKGEHTPRAFFAAIGACIGEVIDYQPRAHGDRLTPENKAWQRRAARALPPFTLAA
jgi:hypothetical protein